MRLLLFIVVTTLLAIISSVASLPPTLFEKNARFTKLLSDSVKSTKLLEESRQWLRSASHHSVMNVNSFNLKINSKASAITSGLVQKLEQDHVPSIHHDPTVIASSSAADKLGERPNIHHDPSKEEEAAASTRNRDAFLLKLSATCDNACFGAMRAAFISADPHFSDTWLSSHVSLVTGTLNSLIEVTASHSGSIEGLLPLISEYKIEEALYGRLHARLQADAFASNGLKEELKAYVNEEDCRSYVIMVAAMSKEELGSFKSRLIEIGSKNSLRFATSFEGSRYGRSFLAKVQMSPSKVEKANGESFYSCDRTLDQAVVDLLADMPEITYIDQYERPVVTNRWSKGLCQSGNQAVQPLYSSGYQLNGTGQIVGVSDTGIDMKNCYFYDPDWDVQYGTVNHNHRKVVYYDAYADEFDDDFDGHGSHVSGSVAGQSYLDYGDFKKYNGVAWGAKLAFFDLGEKDGKLNIPQNIDTALFQKLYDAGARIITNSWVNVDTNSYNALAQQADNFMYYRPDVLIIYSNGNDGDDGSNTVWAPGTFKNGMSVGAASNDNKVWKGLTMGQAVDDFKYSAMMTFSSKGPTADGRMKPDVAAPGSFIMSADGNFNVSKMHCDIIEMQGTSMAAPTAAGATALVREYFIRGFYPTGVANEADKLIPSGALLKAMMIASATEMSNVIESAGDGTVSVNENLITYPDNTQGYGHIDLSKVLNFDRDCMANPLTLVVKGAAFRNDTINFASVTNTQNSETIVVPDAECTSIRAVLTYTDIPTTGNNVIPVVNVLILRVYDMDANNKEFDPYATTTGTTQDNVFVVDIDGDDVIAGHRYKVTVQSNNNLQVPINNPFFDQPFALVIRGDNKQANSTGSSNDDEANILESLAALTQTKLHPQTLKSVIALAAVAVILVGSMISIKLAIRTVLKEKTKQAEVEGDPAERDALQLMQQQQIEIQRQEYEEQQRLAYLAIQQENLKKKKNPSTAPSSAPRASPSQVDVRRS